MISFVVPAYNEEGLLPLTLRAIQRAANELGEPWEMVVADDGSTDRTSAIAIELGARVVRVSNRQIAATRNAGGRAARGEWLLFVDADTIVNSAVVRSALAAMREGAVGGGAVVRFEGRIPRWASALMAVLIVVFRVTRLAAGCFLFCTREAFLAAGGFDETMFGAEEIAMSRALHRQGRFVILREEVVTSGRRMRAHTGWELGRTLGGLVVGGPGSLRDRRRLHMWYEGRRLDPDASAREAANDR